MKTYGMSQRAIPLDDSWDVVVVGGGPSGCTAAVAAAREGARVLLLEAVGCLGGMGTAGLVPAWCPFSDGEKIIYRGLAERVFVEAKKGVPHVDPEALDWVPINPEQLKRVYDDLVLDAGVQVLFNTMVVSVEMASDGVVDAVIAGSKYGLTAHKAGVYVDATGDGDLAAWAGAPWTKGAEGTGEVQPATHCFMLSGVDLDGYLNSPTLHAGNPDSHIWRAARMDRFPLIRDGHCCQNVSGPGTVGFNAGHLWDVDNTDPASVTRALVDGRREALQYRDALAEFHPAFADAYLVTTAQLMGVRETRRIEGDYVLTADDFMARRSFDDEIARNCYFIDIHTSKDEIATVTEARSMEAQVRPERYGPGESHGIPYRCLTPKGLANVVTAGRCISSDRTVQGSTRVMPVCLATGEAAGLAAAMAAGTDRPDVHAVDAQDLRERLKGYGAYLP
jgi:glycine/D-amino acid oxidase-like deaminating enzyme